MANGLTRPDPSPAPVQHAWYASPHGRMLMLCRDGCLSGLFFEGQRFFPGPQGAECASLPAQLTTAWLDAYFAGHPLPPMPPLLPADTAFRRRIRELLLQIPAGRTTTYAALAAATGCPSAARAVANAVAHNPFLILVPCHRVILSNGHLGGYAAGPSLKRSLLLHEGALSVCYS